MNQDIFESFTNINNCISLLKMQLGDVQTNLRKLEKRVRKDIKPEKATKKPASARRVTGFARPMLISSELCAFMGVEEGSIIPRTEVTKMLTDYIHAHGLRDCAHKNNIHPDEKLRALLELSVADEPTLTFYNMQKHLNRHFIKKSAN